MKMKKVGTLFSVVFLAFLVLTSFGSSSPAFAAQGSVLRYAKHFSTSAEGFDPSTPGRITRWLSLYLFHDALVKPMPDGDFSPCLAESWTISTDSRVYEFKLRKGVKFHNGDTMTAEDVVFSFDTYNGSNAKFIKSKIEKLEAVNPYLFRVTFKKPFPDFFTYLLPNTTIAFVLPKNHVEKVGRAEFKKHPVGCGPYKFVEFKPGVRLVGEAFEDFWRKVPNIKRVEIYTVKEASSRYARLKNGEVDIASAMAGVISERIKKDPNMRLVGALSSNSWAMFIADQWDPKSPWYDVRVRKAASLVIDRQTIVDMHFPGAPALGSIALPGDPEGMYRPPDPYAVDEAKKLMAEAGYPKGFDGGKFYPQAGATNPAIGEQIVNYLYAIGITFDIVQLDRPSLLKLYRSGKMKGTVRMEPITSGPIAARISGLLATSKFYGSYPELNSLWEKYNNTIEPEARKDLMISMQKIVLDNLMVIPVAQNKNPRALGPRVKGFPWNIQKGYPIWFPTPVEDIELNE